MSFSQDAPPRPENPQTARALSEREWNKLVNLVRDKCVVPVIGPELLYSAEAPVAQPYYRIWGEELARLYLDDMPVPPGDLYKVANALSASVNQNDLAYDMDDIIRRRKMPVPPALQKLAEIEDISLYITTSIDHLMAEALENAGRGKGMEDISFIPGGAQSRVDLPADFAYAASTGLFHLFGASSSVDGSFAKTEDDLIEFSWSLLDKSYAPTNFYDFLQRKTLLLLGCSFPDWLGRFFLHALNAGAHEERINIYYVSAICDEGLRGYLDRRHAKVISGCAPADFVHDLFTRWSALQATAPRKPEGEASSFKPGAVFLSYASEDREIVRRIHDQLEAANIDSWMDDHALEPGDAYQNVIHENIRNAACFIPVISKTLGQDKGPGRFLWKEWKWAEDAWLERRRTDRYLLPLVIDDTPPGARFIDPPYRDLHWAKLEDGHLPQEIIHQLIGDIRQYRRAK